MASVDRIALMTRILVEQADPVRVVLFGSHARGEARADSDVDLLVIEATVGDRRAEMVRLHRALAPLRVPVDVVVTTFEAYEAWKDVPGTLLYEAAHEGKVVYERVA